MTADAGRRRSAKMADLEAETEEALQKANANLAAYIAKVQTEIVTEINGVIREIAGEKRSASVQNPSNWDLRRWMPQRRTAFYSAWVSLVASTTSTRSPVRTAAANTIPISDDSTSVAKPNFLINYVCPHPTISA